MPRRNDKHRIRTLETRAGIQSGQKPGIIIRDMGGRFFGYGRELSRSEVREFEKTHAITWIRIRKPSPVKSILQKARNVLK